MSIRSALIRITTRGANMPPDNPRRTLIIATFLCASATLCQVAPASTWYVPDQVPTIAEAVALAVPGDTVLVRSGFYQITSTIELTSHQVTVTTVEDDPAFLAWFTAESKPIFDVLADSCEISGFSLWHAYFGLGTEIRVSAGASATVIKGNDLTDCGNAIVDHGHATIINNNRFSRADNPVTVRASSTSLLVDDNDFDNCGGGVLAFAPVTITGNNFLHGRSDNDFGANNQGVGVYAVGVDGPILIDGNAFLDNWATGYSGEPIESKGGAVYLADCANAVVRFNTIEANQATLGAGLYTERCGIAIENNLFRANYDSSNYEENPEAGFASGMYIQDCVGTVHSNTFYRNEATGTSVIHLRESPLLFSNNIVAESVSAAAAIECLGGDVTFLCNDVWNNAPADYSGQCADPTGTGGNIRLDPMFCDPIEGDFTIHASSPCAGDSTPCGIIGAYDIGCGGSDSPEPSAELSVLRIWPNPATSTASIALPSLEAKPGQTSVVRIVGVTGGLVIKWESIDRHRATLIQWDLHDAVGRAVPSGLYFVHVVTNGAQAQGARLAVIAQ